MKNTTLILVLFLAQTLMAKTKDIDFNGLIQNETQSQIETHSALKLASIDRSNDDANKIVFTTGETAGLEQSKSKKQKLKKSKIERLGSNETLQESDFSRIDKELSDLK